ncbi:MAG TPA: MATE family efflux transporter [Phycisphaerae bacterium]|nr:MATE family efflux transporter [Phycisphaerae bacterium]
MTDLRTNERVEGFREVLRLSWPASLSMLSNTVIKFVDGLMVSRVGPHSFSAQFYGSMMAFVPESFMVGTLAVVSTYVSQNFGAGRFRRCGLYAWAAMAIAVLFSAVAVPLALFGNSIFNLLGHEEAALEAIYFRYMILSIPLTLSIRSMEQFFWGIHRPMIVLAAAVTGNLFNVGANYVLIFGKFGFPALGLEGAAIGSVTAWGLQLTILMLVFVSRGCHERFGTRLFRRVRLQQCREVLKLGWPAGVQFFHNIFAWNFGIAILAGTFGLAHRNATTAVMRYMGVSFMPAIGISLATTAIVGKCIGMGRGDLAKKRAHIGVLVACVYMGLCGTAFWLLRYPMVDFFVKTSHLATGEAATLAGDIVRIGGGLMLCAAVFQMFDAIAIVYGGALRGAGETRWPMLVTTVLSWTIILGGGYLMVRLLPEWQSIGPWVAGSAYVITAGLAMAFAFESGVWKRIDLLGKGRRPHAVTLPGAP